jgi:DNA polymerase-3 subunit epsilon
MGLLKEEVFVCFDIEATGLDPINDRIIEIGAVKFTFSEILEEYLELIDPGINIPDETIQIHNITNEMVMGKPPIEEVLPSFFSFIGDYPIVGHGMTFDLEIIKESAKRLSITNPFPEKTIIDTLRLARLYAESPSNSLETLRAHFNIPFEGAHRAMNDVIVNVKVFKNLTKNFKTLKELNSRLKRPISMKTMPLGKHKGRIFKEIPTEYLLWAARQNFDQDLLFSIRSEINKRKKSKSFSQAGNPFGQL